MSKIFFIGAFGYKNNVLNGQTIKTRNAYEVLSKKYDATFFDTQVLQENKLRVFELMFLTLRHKYIFYAGAQSNLQFFFPLLFVFSKLRNGRIVYVTVGGWLFDFLRSKNKAYTYMVKHIQAVLVQTNYLKENLESLGFKNVSWIPNFRITPSENPSQKEDADVLRIVFMARIVKQKGIYLIFDMLEKYIFAARSFKKDIIVDFYGQIEKSDEELFNSKIKKYNNIASYKGLLEPEDIYSTLTKYDVLLLPTFYPGEGFPGSILDAYRCGLPVIATRWGQIPEFVVENETGFLIDYDADQLLKKVNFFANEQCLLHDMKKKAYQKSKQFSSEVGFQVLEKAMFSEF